MDRNVRKIQPNRLLLLIGICSVMGLVLGGGSSWAQSNQCLQAVNPTSQCLTQDPVLKTAQGMIGGLVAGVGAAIGATWKRD